MSKCEELAYDYLYAVENMSTARRMLAEAITLPKKQMAKKVYEILDDSHSFLTGDPEFKELDTEARRLLADTISDMKKEIAGKPVGPDTIQWLVTAYTDYIHHDLFDNMLQDYLKCACRK